MVTVKVSSAVYLHTKEFFTDYNVRMVARMFFNELKKLLTFENPKKKLYLERPEIYPFFKREPMYVKLYRYYHNGALMEIPIAYLPSVIGLLKSYKIPFVVKDERTDVVVSEPYEFLGELFDYQEAAVETWAFRNKSRDKLRSLGLLIAPTGAGKTVMGVKLFTMYGRKTLVVTNTIEIADQWVLSFEKFSRRRFTKHGPLIGLAYRGKRPKGNEDIVIASYQTATRLVDSDPDFVNNFGLVIMDEADLVAADTLYKVAMKVRARYKKGLTATPHRKDGFTFKVFAVLGDIVAKVSSQDLQQEERFVPLKVFVVEYSILPVSILNAALDKNWNELIALLSDSYERNERIAEQVVDSVQQFKMRAIVFVDRVAHANLLAQLITDKFKSKGLPFTAEALVGEKSTKERKRILTDDNVMALVATRLADRGMDLPELGIAHLTMPTSNRNLLNQRIGRVRRVFEGKQYAVVYDYIDVGLDFIFFKYHLPFFRKESADVTFISDVRGVYS